MVFREIMVWQFDLIALTLFVILFEAYYNLLVFDFYIDRQIFIISEALLIIISFPHYGFRNKSYFGVFLILYIFSNLTGVHIIFIFFVMNV